MKTVVKHVRKLRLRKLVLSCVTLLTLLSCTLCFAAERPNIVLIMADDLGYGDTGFTGHKMIKTPHLDQMAADGVQMTNFHAGGPVCSPTRGTFVTGRHYYRYGINTANRGHLPKQEITVSEILKENGYATGHFGKWHLGTLSETMSAKGAKRKPKENFSPPSWHGYDEWFVTESAVQTWDPAEGKRSRNNPFWDNGIAMDPKDPSLKGSASRVVMDRAIPFIQQAVEKKQPFLSVIWFHAPHEDVAAGPVSHKYYTDQGVDENTAHYYGCITELDTEIGRLRAELKRLGVADNTLITFTSDNGPEGKVAKGRKAGTTDGLRGRKRSLYEGGVRVPTLALWPGQIKPGTEIQAPASTLDYFPTVAAIVNYTMPDERPIDGTSLLPLFSGQSKVDRPAIPFRYGKQVALIDGDYKLVAKYHNLEGGLLELYNIKTDRTETKDISAGQPERVEFMRKKLKVFMKSAKKSHAGGDYNDKAFKPVRKWSN